MYPERLILRNFLSFEELDYTFTKETLGVTGENRTEEDQLTNGVGKSTIAQGLFYAIYGVNLRGKEDKKLIRKGTKEAYTKVEIFCQKRKETLIIERTIPLKSSSKVSLTLKKDDVETPVTVATVLDANKYVINWIEITPEDAKSYYIVTKGNYSSFFRSSNTEKLALISRFVNFSNIDKTKGVISEKVGILEQELHKEECLKNVAEGKKQAYEEQIQQVLSEDPEEKKKGIIGEIQSEIYSLQILIEDLVRTRIPKAEKDIEGVDKDIEGLIKLKEEVSKELESFDMDAYKDTYKEIDTEIAGLKKDKSNKEERRKDYALKLADYEKKLQKVEVLLSGVIVCPNCNHKFFMDANKDFEELEADKEAYKTAIDKNTVKKNEYETSINELEDLISQYQDVRKETEEEERKLRVRRGKVVDKMMEVEDRIRELEREKKGYENSIVKMRSEVETNRSLIDSKTGYIEELKKQKAERPSIKDQEKAVEKLSKDIEEGNKKILDKKNEIFKVQQWDSRFKDFKMYLAMEQIKNIQSAANDVLKKMKSDLRLMIEGFKRNANGTLKEEITPYVFRDEMESFFFYSGGEQARVEVALIIAIQSMINATKQYGGMDFLLLDEVLESSDSLGIENIIASTEFLKQSILIVTHVPKLNDEIKQLKVIKENGISRLEV